MYHDFHIAFLLRFGAMVAVSLFLCGTRKSNLGSFPVTEAHSAVVSFICHKRVIRLWPSHHWFAPANQAEFPSLASLLAFMGNHQQCDHGELEK